MFIVDCGNEVSNVYLYCWFLHVLGVTKDRQHIKSLVFYQRQDETHYYQSNNLYIINWEGIIRSGL